MHRLRRPTRAGSSAVASAAEGAQRAGAAANGDPEQERQRQALGRRDRRHRRKVVALEAHRRPERYRGEGRERARAGRPAPPAARAPARRAGPARAGAAGDPPARRGGRPAFRSCRAAAGRRPGSGSETLSSRTIELSSRSSPNSDPTRSIESTPPSGSRYRVGFSATNRSAARAALTAARSSRPGVRRSHASIRNAAPRTGARIPAFSLLLTAAQASRPARSIGAQRPSRSQARIASRIAPIANELAITSVVARRENQYTSGFSAKSSAPAKAQPGGSRLRSTENRNTAPTIPRIAEGRRAASSVASGGRRPCSRFHATERK